MIRKWKKSDSNECRECEKEKTNNDNFFIIEGSVNCYYCGNEIVLCEKCFDKLKNEMINFEKKPLKEITIMADLLTLEDLAGIPYLDKMRQKKRLPSDLLKDLDNTKIILSGYNNAIPLIKAFFHELITNRKCGNIVLPDSCEIIIN